MRAEAHAPVLGRSRQVGLGRGDAEALRRPGVVGALALVLSVLLAVASAELSVFWAVGGGVLLDTMGGSTERWGRERGALSVVALVGWAVVKVAVAILALRAAGVIGDARPGRWTRALAWLVAAQLTVYGGLLTIGGLLAETGLVSPPDDADRHAIAWHAVLWDPWTTVWGVTLAAALWCTRPVRAAATPGR